jgi:TPR repeat protein
MFPSQEGDSQTQFKYAVRLLHGDGIDMNKSLAAHYFKLLADQGDSSAQCNYGLMLLRGDGIDMNKSLAAHYLKLSADQGDSLAQLNYGLMLHRADGIDLNKSLAAHYLTLSADQGDAAAQFNYGLMLLRGDGIGLNKSLAAHYFTLSVAQGHPLAQLNYGLMLLRGDVIGLNKSLAADYLKLSAGQGEAVAQFNYGLMLYHGDGIDMDKSLAAQYFKSSADQGLSVAQVHYATCLLRGDGVPLDLKEGEKYLRLAVGEANRSGEVRLALCLLSGLFGRFDFTEAENLLDGLSGSDRIAATLLDSLSASDCQLVCAAEFSRSCSIFCVLRSSFDRRIPLMRVLNSHLCDFAVDSGLCFSAWQKISGDSVPYFVNLPQARSCDSISSLITVVFQMYVNDLSLGENVNHFLRCFPISMVCNFMDELKRILSYIYVVQSSIECRSHENPILENLVVYRGIGGAADRLMLYESTIDDVVVWSEFTIASTDRDSALNYCITHEECVLFEIELHPGDVAVVPEQHAEDQLGNQVLIAASTGFKVLSVDETDVSIQGEDGCLNLFHIPIVRLSYFLHWYDFDLDQHPPPLVV